MGVTGEVSVDAFRNRPGIAAGEVYLPAGRREPPLRLLKKGGFEAAETMAYFYEPLSR